MDAEIESLHERILEIFGVESSTVPGAIEGAERLPLGGGLAALYVKCPDLATKAMIRRFAISTLEVIDRAAVAERRLEQLKGKTKSLLPETGALTGSGLASWTPETARLELLSSFAGWALVVDGETAQSSSIPPADIETTLRVLERVPERHIPIDRGALYGVKQGDVAIVVHSEQPIEDVDRELVALQAFWVERLLIESQHLESLDALRIEAESAALVRSRFLANMSHELRTPLNGVVGVAQLMEDTGLTTEQRELVDVQLESAQWLRQVIDSVLDFSKVEAGGIVMESVPFDAAEMLSACVRGVEPLVQQKGLTIGVTVDEAAQGFFLGDPARLRQALLNLLSNAIKFTEEGGVEVFLRRDGETLVWTVEDTGIGIEDDAVETIFEAFKQADSSTTRRFGGTGLGLPLVREFATLHGGGASAERRVEGGSRFWFSAAAPVASQGALEGSRAGASAAVEPAASSRSLRVLLVEDQPVNRLIATRMIEARGHTVEYAEDGLAAWEHLETRCDYDLLLVDQMMPRMSGPELCRKLRACSDERAELCLVSLSAGIMPEDIALYEEVGFDEFLCKPIDRAVLDATLARVAAGWEGRRAA